MSIEMTMSVYSEEIAMDIDDDNAFNSGVEENIVISLQGTTDYTKLDNIPLLNGTPLIGNVEEIDPTVPDWAKNSNKPEYNPEEIGAINANSSIPLDELASMFD